MNLVVKKCRSTGWSKKSTLFCFSFQSCFAVVFHIFQVVQIARLGDSFDTNMDPTGRYTTQQRIKIIKAYLTQRQCWRDFDRNNVPDRGTIQRLVAIFRETGSVADAQKSHSGRHRSAIIPENIQNLRERIEESPRKSTHHLSQETGEEKGNRCEHSYLPTRWSSSLLFRQIFRIPWPVFSW